jgi:hypothetical protein
MEKARNQHGDVILKVVAEIPDGAKRLKVSGVFVVEKGEGVHTHIITDTDQVEAYEKDGVLYLKTGDKPVNLTHEEHGTQTLEPNKIYRKDIEQEFDYESNEARNTRD